MKRVLLSSNFFGIVIFNCVLAAEESCVTSVFMSETTTVCVSSKCPEDSIIKTYRNGLLASERHFINCTNEKLFVSFHENGDTLACSKHFGDNTIGLHRIYYTGKRPERFTNYDSSGLKQGWEVFWYDNGNVKDSILFRKDSTMQRSSYYYNGKLFMREKDIYDGDGYDAISYNPKGKKTGEIKNGTGTVFVCDSVGGNCKKLTFKDDKMVYEKGE